MATPSGMAVAAKAAKIANPEVTAMLSKMFLRLKNFIFSLRAKSVFKSVIRYIDNAKARGNNPAQEKIVNYLILLNFIGVFRGF